MSVTGLNHFFFNFYVRNECLDGSFVSIMSCFKSLVSFGTSTKVHGTQYGALSLNSLNALKKVECYKIKFSSNL